MLELNGNNDKYDDHDSSGSTFDGRDRVELEQQQQQKKAEEEQEKDEE